MFSLVAGRRGWLSLAKVIQRANRRRSGFVLLAITVATACTKPSTGNPERGTANVSNVEQVVLTARSGIEKIRTG
jgi:hypothetical protein